MQLREINIEELKKIQVDILCYVDEFCCEHNIRYWLDCGTLLGAVRHKGYIPWDDDIDIGMLREDYEKFMKLFPGTSERYAFCSMETTPNYYQSFGKVIDTNTVLYEGDMKGAKLAVYIDVFVYDNAPDDDAALKRMYDMRDFWRKLNNAQVGLHRKTNNSIKEVTVKAGSMLMKAFPRGYFVKKLIENSKKYAGVETKRVGNFTSNTRMAGEKSIFSDFIKLPFEDKAFYVPVGYDRWLKAFYGDYMVLPPEEKRVCHHQIKAYIIQE